MHVFAVDFFCKNVNIMFFSVCVQAPLCIEGWDEALHEIGKLSHETVLSPEYANSLLKAVEDLPILVIAGAEDALVPLKSIQTMASKLRNSVSIFGCHVLCKSSASFI